MFLNCGVEKTFKSLLDCKEIQLVNSKGNQPWIFIARTVAETEAAKVLEKTLMLGKIEGRRRRGTTAEEMVGWHHQLNGHEFAQAPDDGEGHRSLTCCGPWYCKESD